MWHLRWLFSTVIAVTAALAGDMERFEISQVYPQLPVMTGYIDVVDSDGQPVTGLIPSNLSGALGTQSLHVSELTSFKDTGEGVAYIFLVDISESIPAREFAEMRAAIETWVSGLGPKDRAALSTFGERYTPVVDFTADKQKLVAALTGLSAKDAHTVLYTAIDQGVELARRTDVGLSLRRAIVVLSDGKDEGSALAPEDILRKIRLSHLPIFAIGYSHLPKAQRQQNLDVLHRFANVSGGVYRTAASEPMEKLYAEMGEAIHRVFRIKLNCPDCPADGRGYRLQLTVNLGGRGLSDSMEVIPWKTEAPPPPAVVVSWWQRIPWWGYLLIAVAVIAAIIGVLRYRKPKPISRPIDDRPPLPPPPSEDEAETEPPPEGEPLRLKLIVVAGKSAGRTHALDLANRLVIGRADDCGLKVPDDPKVSQHHCELALVQGQVLIKDLGSQNSTCVNGVPIRGYHRLENQDSILVGDTEFRLRMGEK